MQQGEPFTRAVEFGDVGEQRGDPDHLPVRGLQPERRDGHHRAAGRVLDGADDLLRADQRPAGAQHVVQPALDGRRVLPLEEVAEAAAAQVRGETAVGEQMGVGADEAQPFVEDGQADPVLEEEFAGERLVLAPAGDLRGGGGEHQVAGGAGAVGCA